jgi:hypothetical protein
MVCLLSSWLDISLTCGGLGASQLSSVGRIDGFSPPLQGSRIGVKVQDFLMLEPLPWLAFSPILWSLL